MTDPFLLCCPKNAAGFVTFSFSTMCGMGQTWGGVQPGISQCKLEVGGSKQGFGLFWVRLWGYC